jgi:hypothetical protein
MKKLRSHGVNDTRDEELGNALFAAVSGRIQRRNGSDDTAGRLHALAAAYDAGSGRRPPRSWTGVRSWAGSRTALFGLAAAAVVAVGVTATMGSIRSGLRADALEFARTVLPEASLWVAETLSGRPAASSDMEDFVNALWSSGGPGSTGGSL